MRSIRVLGYVVLIAGLSVTGLGCTSGPPLAPGGNPGGGGTGSGGNVILNQTANCLVEIDGFCRVRLGFNPTQANRGITVNVTASLTNSRPAFTVIDVNNNVVANVQNPTTNVTSATFNSNSTSQHTVVVTELVNPQSTYTVEVRQN